MNLKLTFLLSFIAIGLCAFAQQSKLDRAAYIKAHDASAPSEVMNVLVKGDISSIRTIVDGMEEHFAIRQAT
jgi:hypothetical protein